VKHGCHICLVSAQPVPNLTPLIDQRLGARRALLLVTPDMEERAAWLRSVLRPRGVSTENWAVRDPWDFAHIQTRVLELLEHEQEAVMAGDMALNATGGTKLMSIAAYEACRAYGIPIYYVHPLADRLVWLQPEDRPDHPLAERLGIEEFLQAHGAEVEGEPRRNVPNRADLELGAQLVDRISYWGAALGRLNWLAGQAKPPGYLVTGIGGDEALEELIDLFATHGCLQRQGANGIRFEGEEGRFFANGGWFEVYVFDRVRRLRRQDPHIRDVAYGVRVLRRQRDRRIPNELDVVVLRDNRLHIIECKTRRFQGTGEDSPGAEALYRLDALRDLMGGLQARAMLVSFRDLAGHDRTRAADLQILVCAGEQVSRIDEYLCRLLGMDVTGL